MSGFFLGLMAFFAVLAIVGFVIKALFWLAVGALALFIISAVTGLVQRSTGRHRPM